MPEALTIWEAQFGDFLNARAGDRRSVPRVGRGQVEPALRAGPAPAARHGGAGAGALLGAPGALPRALGGRQLAGGEPHHAGAATSTRSGARCVSPLAQAAGGHVAEEPAPAPARRVAARGARRAAVPAGARRRRRPTRARSPGWCCARARSTTISPPRARRRGRATRRWCGSSSSTRCASRRSSTRSARVPAGRRAGLGAGGAVEHGRVGVREPAPLAARCPSPPRAGRPRARSASPAVGSATRHKLEQEQLVREALGEPASSLHARRARAAAQER